MRDIFRRPYIYWFIGIFLFYIALNMYVSDFYYTIPLLIKYASVVDKKIAVSLVLSLAIGFFVATNSLLVYLKFKERRKCHKESFVATVGAIGGMMVGVCPICVGGLFPILLGFLGVSFSFASMPLKGLEFQVAILIILLISFRMLTRKRKNKN